MSPLVDAEELYRFYRAGDEEVRALRGVSLAVAPGEFVAVVGPSGSGKSTLLACVAGLDEPDGGQVRIAGVRLSHRPEPERAAVRAASIGVLFQSGNLLDHLTVRGNIDLVQRLRGATDADARDRLLESLRLGPRSGARPGELSGGEAVRAGLAVAMACGPAVLLADEPTGELDEATEADVLVMLRETAGPGRAVLVASHSRAVAAAADRVVELHDGRIVDA
jgi:putative ABC transport system ATP-binding protein